MALNKITKGMSNAAEVIDGNFNEIAPHVEDSGWIVLTPNAGFEHYASTDTLKYRKIGNIVTITGSLKNKSILLKGGLYDMCKLPSSIVPEHDYKVRSQGSGVNTFLLYVRSEGNLQLQRYGATAEIDCPPDSWLNIGATYMV